MGGLINAIIDAIMKYAKDNIKDDIRLAFQQPQKERGCPGQRIIEGNAKSRKKQGRPQGGTNMGSQKEGYIKQGFLEQGKDFDGRFSDAKIMQVHLPSVSRGVL